MIFLSTYYFRLLICYTGFRTITHQQNISLAESFMRLLIQIVNERTVIGTRRTDESCPEHVSLNTKILRRKEVEVLPSKLFYLILIHSGVV